MSIITISRGSYSHGREIAELVAKQLDYTCISREILLEASEQFNIPEIKLVHAIEDVPSFFHRLSSSQDTFLSYIQLAFLRHMIEDNIVYHGYSGHFFVKDVSHVLKVRIIADIEDRIDMLQKKENLTHQQALSNITRIDDSRRKWSTRLHGMNTEDPSIYDLIINTRSGSLQEAADIICYTAHQKRFHTTTESQEHLKALLLQAEVMNILGELSSSLICEVKNGIVTIRTDASHSFDPDTIHQIEKRIKELPGIKEFNFSSPTKTPHTNPFHNI